MGAKTWMLVYSKEKLKTVLKNIPAIDREATTALVNKLFPSVMRFKRKKKSWWRFS